MSHCEVARMPESPKIAVAFMRAQEDGDRKNARVIDKVMLALPRELSSGQRAALVRAFAEEVTAGRAPWLAAFHDRDKDAQNPHCHLIIRDRDPATGKRVIGMSEVGSTDKLRQLWEAHANRALDEAGRADRIDRRTLKEQGISREPTIHEGVRARQIVRRGRRPQSRQRNYRNNPRARSRIRQVDYRRLDKNGGSRVEWNETLRRWVNERELWHELDGDRLAREWEAEDSSKHRVENLMKYMDSSRNGDRER